MRYIFRVDLTSKVMLTKIAGYHLHLLKVPLSVQSNWTLLRSRQTCLLISIYPFTCVVSPNMDSTRINLRGKTLSVDQYKGQGVAVVTSGGDAQGNASYILSKFSNADFIIPRSF